MKQIDTRGLSCPQPVVLVHREIINSKDSFEILLDSEASRENVTRLLSRFQLKPERREEANHTVFIVHR